MKLSKTILIIIAIIMLFTSCSSVYVTPNDTSDGETIVNADEYFTDGSVHRKGDVQNGYFYEGCWIYMEYQRTIGPCGAWDDGRLIYGDVTMSRIVKYNPITGVVSSPCLDPVCNHSYESGCVMLAPHDSIDERNYFFIDGIIGDWMVIKTQYPDDEFGSRNKTILYNLKTGESKEEFREILGGDVVTIWVGCLAFDGKYYKIKRVLDFSETDYIPGGKGQNIYDYTPKTVYTLCEYDFETQTIKELFEVPEGFKTACATNKRFFFGDDENIIYSCNRDGSNMKKEDVLNFPPENRIGTYAYKFSDIDGFIVYDLKTNKIKTVTSDFDEYMMCVLTEDGVLFEKVEGLTPHREFVNNRQQFFEEHSYMDYDEMMLLYNEEALRLLHSGKTQILKTDHDGENMRLIFEDENAVIYSVFAT